MATYKKKRKLNWKSIISVVLVVAVVIALGVGIKTFANDDTRTVSKIGLFEVGAISEETGKYVENKAALYTEKVFECQGLTVTPDFDNSAKYQIFWYNEDEIYFGCTEILENKFADNIPECAKYCRIVVFPETVDENGKEIKDFSIKFYEKLSYVKTLKIEVNKEQVAPVDYYELAFTKKAPEGYNPTSIADPYDFFEHKWIYRVPGNTVFQEELMDFTTSEHCVVKVKCDEWSQFKVYFNDVYEGNHELYIDYYDVDGNYINRVVANGTIGGSYIGDIPEGAAYVCFGVWSELRPIVINAYLPR